MTFIRYFVDKIDKNAIFIVISN